MLDFFRRNNYFLFDLYISIYIFAYGIEILTAGLLVQDKICRVVYNQSERFCQTINQDIFYGHQKEIKDRVLGLAASFQIYSNLIQTIPLLLWSMFIGSFLDRHRGSTKIIFAWMNFIGLVTLAFYLIQIRYFSLNPYYILFSNVFACFTGGMATFLTATNRYIALITEPKYRPIRFTCFQISLMIALALGSLAGGHLIVFTNGKEQLRNYNVTMWSTMGMHFLSFIMILVIPVTDLKKLNNIEEQVENGETSTAKSITESSESDNLKSYSTICDDNGNKIKPRINNQNFRKQIQQIWEDFFDWENVRETIRCFSKQRPNQIREHIILLVLVLFMFFINFMGLDSIFLQFSQKVYQFDAQMYANVSAFSKIIPNAVLLLASYILVSWLQLPEGPLLAFTISAGFISQVLVGTFTNVFVYLGSLIIGSIFGLSSVLIKTKLSKIVPKDEIGKIFSLTSTFESLAPLFGSIIFSTIFAATVSTYPTLIYHVASFITLICLILTLFQDIYFVRQDT